MNRRFEDTTMISRSTRYGITLLFALKGKETLILNAINNRFAILLKYSLHLNFHQVSNFELEGKSENKIVICQKIKIVGWVSFKG